MRRGDFAAAWRISDEVLRRRAGKPCWDWPRHLQHVWDGAPLDGRRVLVRCYHGLGDTLQFVRYASLLADRGCTFVLWSQPALLPLMRKVRGVSEVYPLHDGAPDFEYDVEVELMELPHVFRSTLENLPRDVPYLSAEPETAFLHGRRSTLEVGVVWQSGAWDSRRSVPLRELVPWTRIPGLRLHALQRGEALAEWTNALGADSGHDDPAVLAARMRSLDAVITVDSMPAHLAGALAVPTWTLLHSEPDWRWMLGRDDSPWYPTMRLFRQETAGDWKTVCSRVGLELAKWVRTKSASRPRL